MEIILKNESLRKTKTEELGMLEKNKVRILGTGVATLDIYPKQKRMYPGGNEYNIACNAAFVGAEAGFMGVFANDQAGEILEGTLKNIGVDASFSHHEEGSSGYSLVELKEDGDRVFLMWNKEGVTDLYPITFTEEEIAYVKKYDVICMGRLCCVDLSHIKRMAKDHEIPICYDFHAAFTEEVIREVAPYITYGFFSCWHLKEEEIKKYLKLTVDLGCKIAVGTRGNEAVIAYDGTRFYKQETMDIEATDTLGAGDSYIAAFLTGYLTYEKQRDSEKQNVQEDEEEILRQQALQEALAGAAEHAAKVIQMDGSIGVGFDFDPPTLKGLVNGIEE